MQERSFKDRLPQGGQDATWNLVPDPRSRLPSHLYLVSILRVHHVFASQTHTVPECHLYRHYQLRKVIGSDVGWCSASR